MTVQCGSPHPDNDVLGWACERPRGHEGPHAVMTWEEWETGDD